jgi:hypothetical protein
MKHAGAETLDRLEPLLGRLRGLDGLRERKRGVFYRGSGAFLHFHDDPAGIFADLKLEGVFQRFRVSTARGRQQLLSRVRSAL